MRLRLHARSGSVELVSPDERLAMPRRATLRSSTVATLLLCLGAGACAKTDAEWVAQLADPDPFARALAVIALAEQAPELADTALEVALETVDRAELGLAIPAAIALAKFAPHAADSLVDMFVEDELKTLHWKQAVLGALVSAGPGAVPAILGAVRGPGRARANELGMVLIQAGPRSVAPLVDVLERDPDPALKSYAAWVLGQIGPAARAAMPALEGAMVGAAPELQADLRAALARVRGTPP